MQQVERDDQQMAGDDLGEGAGAEIDQFGSHRDNCSGDKRARAGKSKFSSMLSISTRQMPPEDGGGGA